MKKRLVLFVTIICIICGMVAVILLNSDYYYAKRLVYAIEAEDIAAIEQILGKRPHCVNTYPQILPERIFNTLGENRGTTYPLIVACGTDNFEIVKMLVEAGADVNCNDGRTPLSLTYCAKNDYWYEISLYLIDNGASLDYVTEYSGGTSSILMDIVYPRSGGAYENKQEILTAFNYAIENCDQSKVNWLWTLQISILFDRIEIVEFLLEKPYVGINDADADGWTPLMQAVTASTPEMVQLLLDRGADKTVMDSGGRTAYDYAVEKGKDDVASLFAN